MILLNQMNNIRTKYLFYGAIVVSILAIIISLFLLYFFRVGKLVQPPVEQPTATPSPLVRPAELPKPEIGPGGGGSSPAGSEKPPN